MKELITDTFKIDFVGIGATKSGTTWLGHMLEAHPQLCMSVPKEVHFFNDKLNYQGLIREINFPKGINWYRKYFNHCAKGKLKGEITPRYSTDPVAVTRIWEHNKDIKILYCLRNPVERIESHYNFAKYFTKKEERDIQQAIREENEFIEMSLYFRNLSYYLQQFPREQLLLIWFEDIRDRPEELLKEVYTFLGVDPSFQPIHLHEKSNPSRTSQIKGLQTFIQKMQYKLADRGFSSFIEAIKRTGIGKAISRLNSKPLKREKIPPDLKQYILDQVRSDVLALQAWSGRDLSHWLK